MSIQYINTDKLKNLTEVENEILKKKGEKAAEGVIKGNWEDKKKYLESGISKLAEAKKDLEKAKADLKESYRNSTTATEMVATIERRKSKIESIESQLKAISSTITTMINMIEEEISKIEDYLRKLKVRKNDIIEQQQAGKL